MRALADIIAQELASPLGRSLQKRLLEAMFLMERSRGIDAGWRDVVPQVGEADVGADAIARLAEALRTFISSHRDHPDVGSAIWALGALRADEDAALFGAVLRGDSQYGSFAREQAQAALEVIRGESMDTDGPVFDPSASMKFSYKKQVVLQLPGDCLKDYDSLIELEDAIIAGIGNLGEVDGHDMGAGEMNIFIHTDHPKLAFDAIKTLLGTRDFMPNLKAAFRDIGEAEFTILYPPGLREFRVA